MAERIDWVSRSILVALLGLLPFFFVPLAWVTTMQAKIALVSTALFVVGVFWIIARLLDRSIHIPRSAVIGAMALLPLAYAVSTAVNGVQAVSLVGSGREADTLAFVATAFGALVLVAAHFISHPTVTKTAVHVFMIGLLILGLVQVFHLIFPNITLGGILVGQTGNTFGSWHSFAFLMGMLLVSSVSFAGVPGSPRRPYLSYISAAIAFFMLVVTNYFDVWLTVVLATTTLLVVSGYRAHALKKRAFWSMSWLPLVIIVISIIFVFFGSFIAGVLPERIRPSQLEVRPSWQGTLSIGEQTLTAPLSLFFGSGPNTFTRQWGLHRPLDVNQTPFWNADFITGVAPIPTSFVTTGIVGVLAWIVSIAALVFIIIRSWMRSNGELPRTTMALSIICLALATFHLLSVPDAALTLLFFLLVGVLVAEYANASSTRSAPFLASGWRGWLALPGVIIFAGVILGSSGALARVTASELLMNKAIVSYNTTGDTKVSSDLVGAAIRVYPSDRAHRAAVELGLLELQSMIANADPNEEAARYALQKTLERTIEHGLEAVEINGGDYQNWLQLAYLYSQLAGANVKGAYENARAAFEKALENNPTSPLPYVSLAELELLHGQRDLALQYLEKALERKQNLALAHYISSQIYADRQDFVHALPAAVRAVELAPNDTQAWYNAGVIAYAAKDYVNAAVALEQALALQPQFANALYVLALSYVELGRNTDAIRTLTALDNLDPGQEVVQQLLGQLQAGGEGATEIEEQ